jgi:hypothetical protein
MGPSDRPLRGHRAPSLIFLGLVLQPLLSVVAQTQISLREFLVPQFKRIDVPGHFVADRNCIKMAILKASETMKRPHQPATCGATNIGLTSIRMRLVNSG